MADRARVLTDDGAPRTGVPHASAGRWQRLPWWVRVSLVYAAARLLTTIALAYTATRLTPASRAGANPDFFSYTTLWDGYWYWYIAAVGYPTELPTDAAGYVAENQWAFMPVYPGVVSAVSALTGAWWPAAAFFVSLLCGFGAALVIYRLFLLRLDEDASFFATVLFSVSPMSFILQMAYAESMQLFLLAVALYLLVRRSWGWLFPVVAVLALTRPTGLALALALGLYWIVRLIRREVDPFPAQERLLAGALAVFSGVMGLVWPAAAWLATGSVTAYTDTELAWRAPIIGQQPLLPFAPWFQAGNLWLGFPLGAILVVLVAAAFGAILVSPPVKRLGVEMRLWMASYALYLLAVFFPQSSTFRLLMPMFPLAGVLAQPRNACYRAGVVLLSLALQFAWLWLTWGPVATFLSVP